jgi:chromosomal replication initiator protein
MTSNEPNNRLATAPEQPAPQLAEQWARVRGRLQQEVGDVEYRTWLRQMTLVAVDGDEVTVYLPTRFLRDWVRSQYGDKLDTLWRLENSDIRRVDLRVAPQPAPNAPLAASLAPAPAEMVSERGAATPDAGTRRPEERTEARHELYASLDPRFSFEAFVVGKPNEFAYACCRRVAERPASPEFNPLFLYGGVGLG